jgi:cytochrome c551
VTKAVLKVVQVLAVLCAAAFVVALFANEPDPPEAPRAQPAAEGGADAGEEPAGIDGAAVYSDGCAGCHGANGQGGVGPRLADGRVVERFPDIDDQIAVVTDGRGGMPSFDGRLSADEIAAVVDYTRAL